MRSNFFGASSGTVRLQIPLVIGGDVFIEAKINTGDYLSIGILNCLTRGIRLSETPYFLMLDPHSHYLCITVIESDIQNEFLSSLELRYHRIFG